MKLRYKPGCATFIARIGRRQAIVSRTQHPISQDIVYEEITWWGGTYHSALDVKLLARVLPWEDDK